MAIDGAMPQPRKAAVVVHHDDPPCHARLVYHDGGNWCPACRFHPDMQSLQLRSYCPECDVELLPGLSCPTCTRTFASPFEG